MSDWLKRLSSIHRFCVNQLVYPLVLSSLLACALYAGRVYLSHRTTFSFFIWNLFLAWVPYLCSLAMTWQHRRDPGRWWLLALPAVLWLIFLPNAPYMITDILHVDDRPPVPQWYDLGLIATFVWTGFFLGIVSLRQMQNIVARYFGAALSWLFIFATAWLCGVGIFLGRFHSMNSWDLFFRPRTTLFETAQLFSHPWSYPQPFGVTLLFGAFLLVCYVMIISIEHRQGERVES